MDAYGFDKLTNILQGEQRHAGGRGNRCSSSGNFFLPKTFFFLVRMSGVDGHPKIVTIADVWLLVDFHSDGEKVFPSMMAFLGRLFPILIAAEGKTKSPVRIIISNGFFLFGGPFGKYPYCQVQASVSSPFMFLSVLS